jgi:hypothetical protein
LVSCSLDNLVKTPVGFEFYASLAWEQVVAVLSVGVSRAVLSLPVFKFESEVIANRDGIRLRILRRMYIDGVATNVVQTNIPYVGVSQPGLNANDSHEAVTVAIKCVEQLPDFLFRQCLALDFLRYVVLIEIDFSEAKGI